MHEEEHQDRASLWAAIGAESNTNYAHSANNQDSCSLICRLVTLIMKPIIAQKAQAMSQEEEEEVSLQPEAAHIKDLNNNNVLSCSNEITTCHYAKFSTNAHAHPLIDCHSIASSANARETSDTQTTGLSCARDEVAHKQLAIDRMRQVGAHLRDISLAFDR